MGVLEWITAIVLVVVVGGIGGMKLSGNEDAITQSERLGYDKIRTPIGVAEVLAAIAVLLGAAVTDLEWLGIAGAVGIIAMMVGAMFYHVRARDTFEIIPSIVVTLAAVLYIVALNAN